MRFKNLLLIIFLIYAISVVITNSAFSATYYVRNDGNDIIVTAEVTPSF